MKTQPKNENGTNSETVDATKNKKRKKMKTGNSKKAEVIPEVGPSSSSKSDVTTKQGNLTNGDVLSTSVKKIKKNKKQKQS